MPTNRSRWSDRTTENTTQQTAELLNVENRQQLVSRIPIRFNHVWANVNMVEIFATGTIWRHINHTIITLFYRVVVLIANSIVLLYTGTISFNRAPQIIVVNSANKLIKRRFCLITYNQFFYWCICISSYFDCANASKKTCQNGTKHSLYSPTHSKSAPFYTNVQIVTSYRKKLPSTY